MMPRALGLAMVGLCAWGALAQVEEARFGPDMDALGPRLAALSPEDPEGYLLLGEALADEASDAEDVALARRLLVLALDHGRRAGRADVAGSAARALASMAGSDTDRRWLEAIAVVFEGGGAAASAPARGGVVGVADVDPEVAHRAAAAFGLARSGRANLAERSLRDPRVAALIRRYDDVLRSEGLPGAEAWLRAQIESWPIGVGSLDRIERVPGEDPPRYRFDRTNGGDPGPKLTDRELVAFLRLESRLLSGIHRSWAAQLAADQGAPLRDPDPGRVPRVLGVDASLSVWRDGVWMAPVAPREPVTGGALDSRSVDGGADPEEPGVR